MPVNTLMEFANRERTLYSDFRSRAQTELSTAQSELTAAQTQLTARLAELQALDKEIAALRVQLAQVDVPSKANSLMDEITQKLIAARALQGSILDARTQAAVAQAAFQLARTRLDRASQKLAQADALWAEEDQATRRRQAWKEALQQPPLKTLQQNASAALVNDNTTLYGTVMARLAGNNELTQLRTYAAKRHEMWSKYLEATGAAVDAAESKLGIHLKTNSGLDGSAAQLGQAFRKTEREVQEFVLRGKEQYDRALKTLATLAADNTLPLPQNEVSDLKNFVNVAKIPDALTQDSEVVAAQKALDAAKRDLEDQRLSLLATNPTATELQLEANADYKKAKDLCAKLSGDLQLALGKYVNEPQLDAWCAIVSDPSWRQVLAFLDAESLLTALSKKSPSVFAGVLQTRELAYAQELEKAADSARSAAFFQEELDYRRARLEALRALQPTRLLSAIRGDD